MDDITTLTDDAVKALLGQDPTPTTADDTQHLTDDQIATLLAS